MSRAARLVNSGPHFPRVAEGLITKRSRRRVFILEGLSALGRVARAILSQNPCLLHSEWEFLDSAESQER